MPHPLSNHCRAVKSRSTRLLEALRAIVEARSDSDFVIPEQLTQRAVRVTLRVEGMNAKSDMYLVS